MKEAARVVFRMLGGGALFGGSTYLVYSNKLPLEPGNLTAVATLINSILGMGLLAWVDGRPAMKKWEAWLFAFIAVTLVLVSGDLLAGCISHFQNCRGLNCSWIIAFLMVPIKSGVRIFTIFLPSPWVGILIPMTAINFLLFPRPPSSKSSPDDTP